MDEAQMVLQFAALMGLIWFPLGFLPLQCLDKEHEPAGSKSKWHEGGMLLEGGSARLREIGLMYGDENRFKMQVLLGLKGCPVAPCGSSNQGPPQWS